MRFANPAILWLMTAAVPLLIWFLWWAWRKKVKLIGQFVQSRLLAQLTVGVSARRQKLRLALLVGAVTMILFALARPQYGFVWEEVKQRGLDIVVAIDTSRSMLATDAAPNRLTRAKLAALDLMHLARSDRLGLVAFAGTAFLQCPLTLDDEAFRQSVNALDVGIIPQGGTALAEAIETALKAFKEGEESFRVLVIFTDGEDHDGGALAAAERAAKASLRIFTVGVGTPAGERLAVTDEQGRTTYVRDEDGKEVTSRLNSDLLRQIAHETEGEYLELRGAKPMDMLYERRLAPLPKSDLAAHLFQQYYERFQWPLGLALVLLALELLLPERKRVPRPEAIVEACLPSDRQACLGRQAGHPELRKLVASLLLLTLPQGVQASPSRALRDYEAGRFDRAQGEYERLLKKQADDPRLHYNAGTAAYRAGHYAQATNELGAAIRSSDPELLKRAYYNLGNTYYRLGEAAAEPEARIQNWQQSLQHYASALKLDSADADAKFNHDWVAKRLEQLQQQQPKSQGQSKDQQDRDQNQEKQPPSPQKQEQDKQPQQDQEKHDEQAPSQQDQQAKQDQQQPQQSQNQQANQNQPQPDQQDKKEQPAKQDQDQGEPGKQRPKPGEQSDEEDAPGQAAAVPLGQMTPEQARQLLDAAKAEEKPMIFLRPKDAQRRARSVKDW